MSRGAVCLLAACAAFAGCAGGSDNRQAAAAQGFQPGQPGQPSNTNAYPTAPSSATAPAQPASFGQQSAGVQPLGNVWSDPGTLQSIIAGALAGGAASLSGLTGGELRPIEEGIKHQASTQAKGMRPQGQLMSAKLQQDGHAQASVLLEPGVCYAIVGFAGFGVLKYEINVITAPPSPPNVLAQSRADGVTPIVGGSEQCLRHPYPLSMQVKIDMHVISGQGLVGAQLYRK